MLQVLILTYHGTPVGALSQKEDQLRKQIWNDYVQRMVDLKGDAKAYPLQPTLVALHWLAQEMRKHNQTSFFLEQLQPDWLPIAENAYYRWSIGIVIWIRFNGVEELGNVRLLLFLQRCAERLDYMLE